MRFHVVSTFNAEGLSLYGSRMIETFLRFWPQNIPMTIYREGWSAPKRDSRIHLVDLEEASPWLLSFKDRHSGRSFKDYRYDAVRFSHKVAAVLHAAYTVDTDILIWMDGDVFTHSPITTEDLESLAPGKPEWISWLDRFNMYPECGFYMINLRHERNEEVLWCLDKMYAKDRLFLLPEYHDSFVLEYVVKELGVGTKTLSANARKTGHPLINGPLGTWFDHLKGARKGMTRSPDKDLVVTRDEEHWQC